MIVFTMLGIAVLAIIGLATVIATAFFVPMWTYLATTHSAGVAGLIAAVLVTGVGVGVAYYNDYSDAPGAAIMAAVCMFCLVFVLWIVIIVGASNHDDWKDLKAKYQARLQKT